MIHYKKHYKNNERKDTMNRRVVLPPPYGQTQKTVTEDYTKRRIALRYWLLGADLQKSTLAMNYAENYHTGTRRDDITPEFAHQISIVSYLRTLLPHITYPDETLAAGFLHDVREDYGVSDEEIRTVFGPAVADAVDAMSKEFRNEKRLPEIVFADISTNEIASIVKLADRIHNLDSMLGVFTPDKAINYVEETKNRFLPMLRQARRNFPNQEPAYENAKLVILAQLKLIETLITIDEPPTNTQ
jgi:(p)ppGpp synthase/HD superfamily hydrolase